MTTLLRLVGLDVKAGTKDIRKFFESLQIPDGGVCIVGGSLQEAFIAFNTKKEAQLAMRNTGMSLKGSQVTLHMSTMTELEHKLEALLKKRKKNYSPSVKRPQPAATLTSSKIKSQEHKVANFSPTSAWSADSDAANVPHLKAQDLGSSTNNPPLDSNTAFLLGVCTVLQGLQSTQQGKICSLLPNVDLINAHATAHDRNKVITPEPTLDAKPGYVRLFGLPTTTTKEDICHFFKGLTVWEAVTNVQLGHNLGCLVKFASLQNARDALDFNQQLLGSIHVEVRSASERLWNSVLQERENAVDVAVWETPEQNSTKESANLKQQCASGLRNKRTCTNHLPSQPIKKPKLHNDHRTELPDLEQVVMVSKLPSTMNKTEIKKLFGCTNMSHRNVLHLLDKDSNRTDTAFLIFQHSEDFDYAMNLSGCHVGSAAIEVSSITKVTMRQLIAKNRYQTHGHILNNSRRQPNRRTFGETQTAMLDPEAQTCLFVRNLPAEVEKSQIQSLFNKFLVRNENITLLHEIDGNGIGEAVVQFKSTKLAQLANKMHGDRFLGSKLLLTLITVTQMEGILTKPNMGH